MLLELTNIFCRFLFVTYTSKGIQSLKSVHQNVTRSAGKPCNSLCMKTHVHQSEDCVLFALERGNLLPFWGVTSFSHERDVRKKQHRRLGINAINSICTIHFIGLWSDGDTVITFRCILKSFGRGVTPFCVIPFRMRITCESKVINQLNQSPRLETIY